MDEKNEPQGPVGTSAEENLPSGENRKGPTWRAWMVAIVVSVALSVTATLLLGGFTCFHPGQGAAAGANGCGAPCCASPGK